VKVRNVGQSMNFDRFSREFISVPAGTMFVRRAGTGPAVLLLHGYPETSFAWHKVAPALVNQFTVIAADLPGHGDSVVSAYMFDDDRISKRAMAHALADVMTELGFSDFAVIGHDRGGRVAYRLALDLPERVRALAVLDVLPILDMADHITYESARQMAHWLFFAQPSTVPETLIGCDPALYVRHILEQWGGSGVIEPDAVDEYIRCMRKPDVLHASAAEYRADLLDLDHDRADRMAARRIACPVLTIWAQGGLAEQFGDHLDVWRRWADSVSGGPLAGGHFIMEESPQELIVRLRPFLTHAFMSELETPGSTDAEPESRTARVARSRDRGVAGAPPDR
jgi:haloacetate dehalogenase